MEGIDLAAANRRWGEIDKKIVDRARLIPLFQPVEWLIVSSRVHNFQNGNGAAMKDQFWVQ
jgi:peptide/nickel transport system substrate-binding protein